MSRLRQTPTATPPDDPSVTPAALASARHLNVAFPGSGGRLRALEDVSLELRRGETLGVVGESGSGKTMLGMAMLGLVPPPGEVTGEVDVCGIDVLHAGRRERAQVRGGILGLVLQDPTASLNPFRTIRAQLVESARRQGRTRREAEQAAEDALRRVGLDPVQVLTKRSFELSGGMNQRVAIAMALIQNPAALIADEPTTALDVIVQLEILELLESLKRSDGMAILLISHDFSVVFQLSDRIAVLYGGKLLEVGSADDVVLRPSHPYTVGLIDAVPRVDDPTRELHAIKGQFAPIAMGEAGCPFASRCPHVMDICRTAFPEATDLGNGHRVHCWLRSEG